MLGPRGLQPRVLPRWALLFTLSVYLVGLTAGYAAGGAGSTEYIEQLASIARELRMLGPVGTFMAILANNLLVTLIAVLGGLIVFIPILVAFVNGVVLGSVLSYMLQLYTIPELLSLLLPHGIFEVPALLVACSLGVGLASNVLDAGFKATLARLDDYMAAYAWVTLLLVIAAVIETILIYNLG